MAKWGVKNEIDYSPNGDDIDTFSQKVKAEESVIYNLLQRLRTLDAGTGSDIDDAEAYQFKINTTTNKILIRDGTNAKWFTLGDIADNFGITPALISAIKNLGGATGVQVGNIADRPVVNNSIEGTFFFAIDEGSLYYFHNSTWILALSIDITKLTGYDRMITKDDVSATNAANKILRTGANGELDCSIKGSAEKLVDLPLDKTNIGDGKVIAYDSSAEKLYFEIAGATAGGGSSIGVIAGRESLKTYSLGEKAYSSRLPSGTYLTCVTSGTTGEYQPDYNMVSNGKVVDGSVEWRKDKLTGTNIQFTSDDPVNQLEGDILIQKISDVADGGKNSSLFIKNNDGVYVPVYLNTTAEQVVNKPAGNVLAKTVQAAINELDLKKAPSGYGLGDTSIRLSAVDLNSIIKCGFYYAQSDCANKPNSVSGILLVNASSSSYAVQIFSELTTGFNYIRNNINNTWSAWKQIPTLDGVFQKSTITGATINTTDWNTLTSAGCYPVNGDVTFSASLNQPVGAYQWGVLLVVYSGTMGTAQLYFTHIGEIWYRTAFNAIGWKAWIRLSDSSGRTIASKVVFPAVNTPDADPNTLDDYEEGTFTPVVVGSTVAGVGSYNAQTGRYTKLGNTVNFKLGLSWTAHTGTGTLRISGLPFVSADFFPCSITFENLVYTNQIQPRTQGSTTQIFLWNASSNSAGVELPMDTAVSSLVISGTYQV